MLKSAYKKIIFLSLLLLVGPVNLSADDVVVFATASPDPKLSVTTQDNAGIPNGSTVLEEGRPFTTDFGVVDISDGSVSRFFKFNNQGGSDLTILSVTFDGTGNSYFSIEEGTPFIVSSGSTSTIEFRYDPGATGRHIVTVEIASNDSEEPLYTFMMAGWGSTPNGDLDGDGLLDSQELQFETSRINADTDSDGSSDSQEIEDGSDPLNPSSFKFRLEDEFCSDWNGFIGMQHNFAEMTNIAASDIEFAVTLFDVSGNSRDTMNVGIGPGTQFDVAVHDLGGWQLDSIGSYCSKLTAAPAKIVGASSSNAIDGRMLMYNPDGAGSHNYVLSMPFQNSLSGPVFSQYNTFHPSLDPAEAGYFVTNWLTVANTEATEQRGYVEIYDNTGFLLNFRYLTLPANSRTDIPVHEMGPNRVGLVQWLPDSDSAKFRVILNRYFYDGPNATDPVAIAVSLPGMPEGLSQRAIVVDTREGSSILELSNPFHQQIEFDLIITGETGATISSTTRTLDPYGTEHVILDDLMGAQLGFARVNPIGIRDFELKTFNIVASVMQYGRNALNGVDYLYGTSLREPVGQILLGSYNTNLAQGCSLLIGNASSVAENINATATDFLGVNKLNTTISVPAFGAVDFDICAVDVANKYGAVKLVPTTPGSIVADVVRKGFNDNYRFITPVR